MGGGLIMQMDMTQYLDVFLEESKEHLGSLNEQLLYLEKEPNSVSALNEIFRAAHTLKGMSSTMGFENMADLTHHMEDVLSDLKDGSLKVNTDVVDVLFQCFDKLQLMIDNIETSSQSSVDTSDLMDILKSIKSGEYEAASTMELTNNISKVSEEFDSKVNEDEDNELLFSFNEYDLTILKEAISQDMYIYFIRVEVDEKCLMKAVRAFMVFKAMEDSGEIVKSNPPAQDLDEGKFEGQFEIVYISNMSETDLKEKINNVSEVKVEKIKKITIDSLVKENDVSKSKQDNNSNSLHADDQERNNQQKVHKIKQTVRVDIERLDKLMNLVGELVMHKGRLEQIGAVQKTGELNETIEQIDRISGDLQSVVMKVRMVPIEQVFNRFPRMVRDLAKDLHKEVDFIIEGKETELDRTVIDEIGDPLVHLLRNAIDHGLEPAEERIKKGKSSMGNLMLRARHEGNNVYIDVEDDGYGIDVNKIKKKAIEKDMITAKEAEQMSKENAVDLLFRSGFSTASAVTDVSGRGVGLDVVKTKIESLNGEIFVESREGEGTKFRIKLPLTLAIIQALMVEVKDEIYAIPLSSVDETTMITPNEIKMIQNQEVIVLRGNVLPLFRLAELIDLPEDDRKEEMYVVIVRKGDRQIGLIVDTLIGQQEIVIKSLGKILSGIPGLAGAIVAGDGNVRLILDIATLF